MERAAERDLDSALSLSFPLPFFTYTLTPTKSESMCACDKWERRIVCVRGRVREGERIAGGEREKACVRNCALTARRAAYREKLLKVWIMIDLCTIHTPPPHPFRRNAHTHTLLPQQQWQNLWVRENVSVARWIYNHWGNPWQHFHVCVWLVTIQREVFLCTSLYLDNSLLSYFVSVARTFWVSYLWKSV